MRILTQSPEETEKLGERVSAVLRGGEVLALFGPMGMGKTAFTRGIAKGLGVKEGVSSPTFALVHEYAGRTSHISFRYVPRNLLGRSLFHRFF